VTDAGPVLGSFRGGIDGPGGSWFTYGRLTVPQPLATLVVHPGPAVLEAPIRGERVELPAEVASKVRVVRMWGVVSVTFVVRKDGTLDVWTFETFSTGPVTACLRAAGFQVAEK